MKIFFLIILAACILTPALTSAQTCPAGRTCLPNPLSFIGVTSPSELIVKASQGLASLMGAIAIAFLVFSGFKLVIATNEEAIKAAKDSITWSVGGFALSVLAFTIISGAAALLGFTPTGTPGDTLDRCGFIRISTACAANRDFISVLNAIMTNFLALVGVVAVGMIIYYGYRYVTAAGNEESIGEAKKGLQWSIIGLVIIILAFTIIAGVQGVLFGI